MDSLEFFRTRGELQLKGGDDGSTEICIVQVAAIVDDNFDANVNGDGDDEFIDCL